MKLEDTAAYTEKCINGEPAQCSRACPLGLDVRTFVEKAQKGKWNAAYRALRNATLFPAIVSALCPAPCEESCGRIRLGDEAVAIKSLEHACTRFAKNQKPDSFVIPPKTERIAVVGAGVAGLSAALCVAQKKYQVTIFDKNSSPGGKLRSEPYYDEFCADLRLQFSAVDVEYKFETEIKSLDELSDFDMIYVATGAGGADFGLLSNWDSSLCSTSVPKVFLGGALTGAEMISGIAQGKLLSKTAEVFLQTGRTFDVSGEAVRHEPVICPVPPETPRCARVVAAIPSGYTESEAKEEAARCLQCDCNRCMTACEMMGSFRKRPKKVAMEVYTDTQVSPPMSTHTLTRQAYSCNMCGYCKDVCPADIDLGGLLQLSRATRVNDAHYPQALHDYWLREMDFSTGEAAYFARPESGQTCQYVFFPGCQLGAHNPEHVIKSYEFLQANSETGIFVSCCGAPALWAGDTRRLNANLDEIRRVWHELGNATFVFACATCESIFKELLPEIQRLSIYELMAQSAAVTPSSPYENAHVFDPCNARGNTEMEVSIRKLAVIAGCKLNELPEKNRCCGYGGHMRSANPALFDKITENRTAMGGNPYIVYCANCREVFLCAGKDCAHILDLVFNLPHKTDFPKIHEKRSNAIMVKGKIMKDLTGEDFAHTISDWDMLELVIDESLAESIDKKLISLSDIREAIWSAESSGDKFVDSDGVCRCSLVKPVLTYWVTYKKTDSGVFNILEAYFHRMRFSGEEVL